MDSTTAVLKKKKTYNNVFCDDDLALDQNINGINKR